MPSTTPCSFCKRIFAGTKELRIHQQGRTICGQRRTAQLRQLILSLSSGPSDAIQTENFAPRVDDHSSDGMVFEPEHDVAMPLESDAPDDAAVEMEDPPASLPRGVTIEEVEDEDEGGYWYDSFPEQKYAGARKERAPTGFEVIRDDQVLQGAEIYGPFENEEEWELAKWLIKNVGQNQAEAFLKLPIVSLSQNGVCRTSLMFDLL